MQLFLSSYDYAEFSPTRKIMQFRLIRIDGRNALVVEVDLPVDGSKYGCQQKEIHQLFLLNRIDEKAFDSFKRFPIDVFVLIEKREGFKDQNSIELNELDNIAWACLYNKEKDAISHKIK